MICRKKEKGENEDHGTPCINACYKCGVVEMGHVFKIYVLIFFSTRYSAQFTRSKEEGKGVGEAELITSESAYPPRPPHFEENLLLAQHQPIAYEQNFHRS
jgi:hypothetical protein